MEFSSSEWLLLMPKRKSAMSYSLRRMVSAPPTMSKSKKRGPYKKKADIPPVKRSSFF
jgi:hypothetical protein